MHNTRARLKAENTTLSRKIIEARENISRFESDPVFVERTAHGMGLVREDELIFKFND